MSLQFDNQRRFAFVFRQGFEVFLLKFLARHDIAGSGYVSIIPLVQAIMSSSEATYVPPYMPSAIKYVSLLWLLLSPGFAISLESLN